jgi:hypothetical protein
MTPKISPKSGKENHALEKSAAAADRGWMSRTISSLADQEKCCFLTSPFIEPALFPFHCNPDDVGSDLIEYPSQAPVNFSNQSPQKALSRRTN